MWGESTGDRLFPSQRASNAESVACHDVTVASMLQGSASEWRYVFFLVAGLISLGGIAFCIFGSGDVQDWAKEVSDVKEKDEDDVEMKPLKREINAWS